MIPIRVHLVLEDGPAIRSGMKAAILCVFVFLTSYFSRNVAAAGSGSERKASCFYEHPWLRICSNHAS